MVGGRRTKMTWTYDTLPDDMVERYGIWYETIYSRAFACVG